MKAIEMRAPGGPEVLRLTEHPKPLPADNEVRIRVAAAGVNRPDILQRQGLYAPPPGVTSILGLEVAGEVDAVGSACERFAVGDRVAALVSGGGYAEWCVASEFHCLPVPSDVPWQEAAAVPETWFTVWANVFELGSLTEGESLLVHGGSSGIGHTAIQLAHARGAKTISTSGSDDKVAFCRDLGVDTAINYLKQDFVAQTKAATNGYGVDLVLDMVGGDYLRRNIDVLAYGGRHVSIAFLRGAKAELPIYKVMAKKLSLTGSFLRSRSHDEKGRLREAVEREIWPLFVRGAVRPHVHQVWSLCEAAEAHRTMEGGDFLGKLVLCP